MFVFLMEIPIPISIIFDTLLKTNVEDDQHPFEKRTKIFPTSILWFHLSFRTSTTCNEHCDVVQKKPQVHAMIISALSSASWYCIVMKLGVVPSTYIYPLVKQMLPWKIRMFLGKDDQTWLILKRPLYIYIYIYVKLPEVLHHHKHFLDIFGSLHICLETSRNLSFSVTL